MSTNTLHTYCNKYNDLSVSEKKYVRSLGRKQEILQTRFRCPSRLPWKKLPIRKKSQVGPKPQYYSEILEILVIVQPHLRRKNRLWDGTCMLLRHSKGYWNHGPKKGKRNRGESWYQLCTNIPGQGKICQKKGSSFTNMLHRFEMVGTKFCEVGLNVLSVIIW